MPLPATKDMPHQVATAILGPEEGRPKDVEISETNFTSIRDTAAQYIAAGLPIEGVTFWGGARQYGQGDKLGIDAADLLALLRYEAMHRNVKAAGHAPGVKVQLVFEDLGRRFMGDDTIGMRMRVKEYEREMKQLVAATSTCVTFTPESQIIAQNEVPPKVREILGLDPHAKMKGSDELFFQVATKAENVIYDYLRRTEKPDAKAPVDANDSEGFSRVENLAEYQAMEKLGFKGGIPVLQRESVRTRTKLRLGNPELSDEALDRHVAKYFAQGFARAVFNLRVGTSIPKESKEPLPTLSYSFLPYPPGTPSSMITRRVELTAVSDTGKDKVVPCWGGCAVMGADGSIRLTSGVATSSKFVILKVEGADGKTVEVPLHLDTSPR
jgi:hypothetical protein